MIFAEGLRPPLIPPGNKGGPAHKEARGEYILRVYFHKLGHKKVVKLTIRLLETLVKGIVTHIVYHPDLLITLYVHHGDGQAIV